MRNLPELSQEIIGSKSKKESLLDEMQRALLAMAERRRTVKLNEFCEVFQHHGARLNIHEQMDADEFLKSLITQLEEQIPVYPLPPPPAQKVALFS